MSTSLEEAIRLAEIGEYLYNRAYSYGNGYDEPREFGIEWQWQQSKPNEFGQGALLAESTKWHADMAEDDIVTEASKLRSEIEKNAKALAHWRDEVGKLQSRIGTLTDTIKWFLDRDERNGSLPEAYVENLRAALKEKLDA